MNKLLQRLINKFKPKDIGHVAMLNIPKEFINSGWNNFTVTVDGFNTKHTGTLTTFSGTIKVEVKD